MDLEFQEDYRPTEDEPYMNLSHLAYFREKLLSWREQLVRESHETLEQLREENSREPDFLDQGASDTIKALTFRTRDRYRKLLKKIDAALDRIRVGTYGYCEESGEEIGIKRLEARPIATLSIEAQEWHEMKEGRKRKSAIR